MRHSERIKCCYRTSITHKILYSYFDDYNFHRHWIQQFIRSHKALFLYFNNINMYSLHATISNPISKNAKIIYNFESVTHYKCRNDFLFDKWMLTMAIEWERKKNLNQKVYHPIINTYKAPCCFDKNTFRGLYLTTGSWYFGQSVWWNMCAIIIKFIIWWKLFKWMGLSVIRSLRFISLGLLIKTCEARDQKKIFFLRLQRI